MTEEQIKQFPKSAEEYFYKQEKDGVPWKAEVYHFFEVINFYRKVTKKLQEELEKWKAEWQEQVQKATDEGYARTLQTIQLTKAKVVLRNVIDYLGQFCSDYPDCVIEAEQFLKDLEK